METEETTRPKVFISYAHQDEAWMEHVVSHLGVLANQGLLDIWVDTQIEVGEDWLPEIEAALNSCCVGVLLVTAHFLNSNFIRTVEVPKLLQRRAQQGVKVYPVICESCPWKAVEWLARMQLRPMGAQPLQGMTKAKRDEALTAIALEIGEIVNRARVSSHGTWSAGPDQIDIGRLPVTGSNFVGRKQQLNSLDKAWKSDKTNIIGFRAWGGVGKSALVNEWLAQRMQPDNWRGAQRVLGWSFYSQGIREREQASADQFIAFALAWFGDPDPTEGSAWDKGRRLADLVRKQKTLLILDGVEPLQNPPGVEEFKIKDDGLVSLLKSLAADNPGLCVLTTRFKVPDLDNWANTTVTINELDRLPTRAGIELLKSLGVNGTDAELEEAVEDLKGHALALTLLGNLLKDEFDGDIRMRKELPSLEYDEEKGGHARRVIECYERVFEGKPELDILRIMGLFDRPAPAGAIEAVKATPAIPGLTDNLVGLSDRKWKQAVRHLREAGLLAPPEKPDSADLDCHPLIREHFAEKLEPENPDAWEEAHRRLYEYYKSVPEKEFPDTLEEMVPLYAAVSHGCQARLHQEAYYDVYRPRILRGNDHYIWTKLGAFGADLVAISSFFEDPWTKPITTLPEDSRSWLLNQAGFYLRALGRLREAGNPMKLALDMTVDAEDWANAARYAGNLSEVYLTIGDVESAVDYARQAVQHADRSGDDFQRMNERTTVADSLHQSGNCAEALDLCREAEAIQAKRQRKYPLLYSMAGYRYCNLLLDFGEYAGVNQRAQKFFEWRVPSDSLLDIALDNLSLGRAHLLEAESAGKKAPREARKHLNEAVDGLRRAGTQDHLPRGLLARAHLHRYGGTSKPQDSTSTKRWKSRPGATCAFSKPTATSNTPASTSPSARRRKPASTTKPPAS